MLTTLLFPIFSKVYTHISKALTDYENHRTDQGFENAMTQKIFVLTFLTGYMSLFLTAYVYGIPLSIVANLQFRLEIILFRNSTSQSCSAAV